MMEILMFLVVVLLVCAAGFLVVPFIKERGGEKAGKVFAIAAEVVKAIDQEFKAPADETAEQKTIRQEIMKEEATQAVKEICESYNIQVPSDLILDKAVEAGVWAMKQTKKLIDSKMPVKQEQK